MFGFLLFIKCFHWLMADRVETMDQTTYPGPPTLFHIRMNLLFGLLWSVDVVVFAFAVESTLSNGVGGMVLFASEYAILMASALNAMARYVLSVLDYRRARTRGGENAPPMENKSMYVFYIELVTDFLKLATYLTFFMIILTFYGLPINIIRDVYLTARSFITRLRALIRYHNATRDMDRRYPNATEAELSEISDRTCIICREEMVFQILQQQAGTGQGEAMGEGQAPQQDGPNITPKKLPCGHIFHFQCLRSWLERQQSCPTCRRTVLETSASNQAQAQGRPEGARAPAPQPGAGPPGGQQAAGGPIGWLGRLLGIQQPLVPAQFAHGQFLPPGGLPQQQPANIAAWAPGQPPPPPFFYQMQYPQYPPQPQFLQQPPAFRGFYGPGGVWQPWGFDPRFGQALQQHPVQQPNGAMSNSAATTPEETAFTQVASAPPVPNPTSATSNSASEHPSTPRDAAALAALQRSNSSRTAVSADDARNSSRPPVPMSETATNVASVGSSSTNHRNTTASDTTTLPSSSVPLPSSMAANGAGATSSQPPNPLDMRPEVPPLVPLYDFGSLAHATRSSAFTPPYSHAQFFRGPPNARPQGQPQPGSMRPSASSQPGPSRYVRGPSTTANNRPPLSQLPSILTDEQLSRLDRLTRDAIDERLRVLEGVSGAVYRCIEELTRARSIIPAATAAAAQSQGQERMTSRAAPVSSSAPDPGASSSGSAETVKKATDNLAPTAATASSSFDTEMPDNSGLSEGYSDVVQESESGSSSGSSSMPQEKAPHATVETVD
ncbi:hypothetical protein AcW1_003667 [Taiwanofungus camphoratus]|nr:hypothetical protein AcW1_003667 [Antrodia cinnamomea]